MNTNLICIQKYRKYRCTTKRPDFTTVISVINSCRKQRKPRINKTVPKLKESYKYLNVEHDSFITCNEGDAQNTTVKHFYYRHKM